MTDSNRPSALFETILIHKTEAGFSLPVKLHHGQRAPGGSPSMTTGEGRPGVGAVVVETGSTSGILSQEIMEIADNTR